MCDDGLQQAMDSTCYGTYIGSRQRLRCPAAGCILPSRPNRIRGTSFVGTFVCELQTHDVYSDVTKPLKTKFGNSQGTQFFNLENNL